MQIDISAFFTFIIIASLTPGPNNISAMAFSMSSGYKKTLPYILGVFTGTFVVMLLCAWVSFVLNTYIPNVVIYMKYIGAAYILYLAYKTLKVNYNADADESVKAGFIDGTLLQLVNPKAVFYGMTVYSTFFVSLINNKLLLTGSALFLAAWTFMAVSIWAGFGAFIKYFMKNRYVKRVFSVVMALGLLYAAYKIVIM